jgi:hypothetical protein
MDTHFLSIMMVILAQDLKPEIRTLAANKRCHISGKIRRISLLILKIAYLSFVLILLTAASMILCRAESWGDGRLWACSAHLRQIVGLFISGNTDVTGYPLHFNGETTPPKFREPLSAPNCEATVRWRVATKAQDGRL